MSKSLKRVRAALDAADVAFRIEEMSTETRTAAQAAEAAGCHLDQIAKSIIVAGETSGRFALFITAGGNQVDTARAAEILGEPTRVPKGDEVRKVTGFAIGGVSPVGHLTPITAYMDPRLMEFAQVWGAAGTPRHIFEIAPGDLLKLTGAQRAQFIQLG